jgi:hypothetical protein
VATLGTLSTNIGFTPYPIRFRLHLVLTTQALPKLRDWVLIDSLTLSSCGSDGFSAGAVSSDIESVTTSSVLCGQLLEFRFFERVEVWWLCPGGQSDSQEVSGLLI